jgi:hypothetical protein
VHAIDRNKHEFKINDADGQAIIRHSHLEKGANTFASPYASKEINEAVNLSVNRGIEHAGAQLRGADDALITQDTKVVKNMNYPFAGFSRFRKGHKVTYGGYMGVVDLACRSRSGRVTLGASAGVVSGDTYPYNTQEDKKYSGFLPLRDQNYFGKYVRSFAMFYGRKIPRPNDMADHKMYAYNHDESTANLRWFGVGGQIHPLKNPQELTIIPVWFSFWEDMPPAKWDNEATRTFGDGMHDAIYKSSQAKYGFSGAADPEVLASRHLGYELSLCAVWKPMSNCEISCALSAFLPGQLYRDVKGMPNYRTRFLKPNADVQLQGLGSGVVLGASGKMAFRW